MVDMTIDQIKANPLLNSMLAPYLQPGAQLQETQAAAGAAGASAALQGAETPGAEANSQAAIIKAQQAGAFQSLREDLHGGMTLSDAMDKYKSLGMSANDIFNQYLSQNKYGFPKENPIDLHGMGVTDAVLGHVGDTGTFADKWNTGSAIEELRLAKDYFNKTKAAEIAGNIAGVNANSRAYENIRNIIGLHLSSLIPGASGAQGTGQELLNMLPSSKDIRSYTPGMIDSAFNSIENGLMTSKRYKYTDVGVNPLQAETQDQTSKTTMQALPKTGGEMLSTLLSNAGKDITGMVQGEAEREKTFGPGFGGAVASTIAGIPGLAKQYADIVENPGQQFTDHPVNTTLAVLAPLLGLKGIKGAPGEAAAGEAGAADAATTATTQAAQDVFAKAPGKLQQLLMPGKSKSIIGEIRDQVISNADKSGNTVSGDNIVNSFKSWADKAKMASPADSAAIDDAVAQAEKNYAGKTFKPSDLKSVYDAIESGYTVKGVPKSATSANIDRGMQNVLQGSLEQAAPGFAKTTDLFRQTYQAEKSPVRSIAKGVAKNATGVGLGLAGLDAVRHILGL